MFSFQVIFSNYLKSLIIVVVIVGLVAGVVVDAVAVEVVVASAGLVVGWNRLRLR